MVESNRGCQRRNQTPARRAAGVTPAPSIRRKKIAKPRGRAFALRFGEDVMCGLGEKGPAQSDSLDLRGASAPATDTGPFLNDRAKVTEPKRDTPQNICRRSPFVNALRSRLCTGEKTQARSATTISRLAPRLFQQSIRLVMRTGFTEPPPPSTSPCRNPCRSPPC